MFKLHNRLHSVGYLLEKSLKMVYIYSGKEKKEKHDLDALLKNAKKIQKERKNIYILLFFSSTTFRLFMSSHAGLASIIIPLFTHL